jgi:diguanylate cyclase
VTLDDAHLRLLCENAPALAVDFYDVLMQHDRARVYLDHEVVEERLKPSLTSWLCELFSENAFADEAAFEARQHKIGEIHARIGISAPLVNLAASRLQSRIAELIRASDRSWQSRYDSLSLVYERINRAIALMGESYVHRVEGRVRAEEAYRLFSMDQDMNLERESQRAGLMHWAQETLFGFLQDSAGTELSPLAQAPFGVWVRHRAVVMFGNTSQLQAITVAIARVDGQVLPSLAAGGPDAVRELRLAVDEIATLLSDMFQDVSEMENGRDALTRTLNRRFLPSILSRETKFASQHGLGLAALFIDVDHFKKINDTYGHHAGDVVLRRVAELISECIRSTDFLFRYGGEEFLVLLVESDPQTSVSTAERIRTVIAEEAFVVGETTISVTVSSGVAVHDGHPDPEHMIKRADDALYRAKRNGRNQVVATGPVPSGQSGSRVRAAR